MELLATETSLMDPCHFKVSLELPEFEVTTLSLQEWIVATLSRPSLETFSPDKVFKALSLLNLQKIIKEKKIST